MWICKIYNFVRIIFILGSMNLWYFLQNSILHVKQKSKPCLFLYYTDNFDVFRENSWIFKALSLPAAPSWIEVALTYCNEPQMMDRTEINRISD